MLFLLRYGAYFFRLSLSLCSGFRCSVSEFGAMRLNLSAALVGGHTRSRSCVMPSFIITLGIVIWYGAVIVLGVRQSGENRPQ
ncbi:conserved domain protein [Ruminococcus albus 8]|uniref:Conserved domain protein n=1 Tax=Ruminococcus albus 8 TaxID=246199 RepID=E9S8G1_RUMAL|nr:conserved domain protein [Ruminococcus albus 8]